MAEAVTKGIRVVVKTEFVPERSDPHRPLFFFAYHITITNQGDTPQTLVSRYWHNTDSVGQEEEVLVQKVWFQKLRGLQALAVAVVPDLAIQFVYYTVCRV